MIKVTSYKSDNIYTYGLGATVAMEYLLKRRDVVRAVILHPGFRSEETIEKIRTICGSDIPVSTEEKPFNILSKKDNCFVIVVIEKKKVKIRDGSHMVLVNPSNCGNMGTIVRSCLGIEPYNQYICFYIHCSGCHLPDRNRWRRCRFYHQFQLRNDPGCYLRNTELYLRCCSCCLPDNEQEEIEYTLYI